MSQKTRAELVTLLNSKVISGGRLTTAQYVRDLINALIESLPDIVDDKNQANGYLGLDANAKANIASISKITPTGEVLSDNGTWIPVQTGVDVEESFTIVGSTQTLSFTPIFSYGYFLEGQRAGLGGKIVSIVGDVITFDADYTGYRLDAIYKK